MNFTINSETMGTKRSDYQHKIGATKAYHMSSSTDTDQALWQLSLILREIGLEGQQRNEEPMPCLADSFDLAVRHTSQQDGIVPIQNEESKSTRGK